MVRTADTLHESLNELARLGRRLGPEHVARIAEKLAQQGLLAGYEDKAPPRSSFSACT